MASKLNRHARAGKVLPGRACASRVYLDIDKRHRATRYCDTCTQSSLSPSPRLKTVWTPSVAGHRDSVCA